MASRGLGAKYQGMNWCAPVKRLAIYLRDGVACAYCGDGIEDGAQLSLDHIVPHSQGGRHEASNLVTACRRCNSARGDRQVVDFAARVAGYLNRDATPEAIMSHVNECVGRELPRAEAKILLARRGSVKLAISRE